MTFKSGKKVAEHVTQADGEKVPEEQIETHGVELTVDKIFQLDGLAVVKEGDYKKAPRKEPRVRDPRSYEVEGQDVNVDNEHYLLTDSAYAVLYNEKIHIPDMHMGLVFPRSRFIRNNAHISTAVWESGYVGRGEGGLHINGPTVIEKGMAVAQFTLCKASVLKKYDGSHQGERVEDTDE